MPKLLSQVSKARVSGEVLGKGNRKVPRGLRGRQVAKDHQRKLRTTRGLPRPIPFGTARASRINRQAAKSGCAGEWGAWGQLSGEGRDSITRLERGPLG